MIHVGAFNTLDGKGKSGPFADIILFTEAVPAVVRADIGDTHDVYVCEQQRDLVIALRKGLPITNVREHWRGVVPGVRKVTPHRGIYWLTFDWNGQPCAVMVEHRINAAFPPFKRGEPWFRRRMWRLHTWRAKRILRRLIRKGRSIIAGGDLNTPKGVSGYQGVLREHGGGLDRLGTHGFRLTDVEHLDGNGSDHPRVRARLRRD